MLFSFHGEIPASFTCPRSSPKHERYVKTLAVLMQAIRFTDSFTFDHVFMHNFKWVISSYHLVSRHFIPQFGLLRALLVHLNVLGTNWQRISLPLFFILCFRGGPLSKSIQRHFCLPHTECPWAVLHHSQLQIVCSDLSWPSFNKNAV